MEYPIRGSGYARTCRLVSILRLYHRNDWKLGTDGTSWQQGANLGDDGKVMGNLSIWLYPHYCKEYNEKRRGHMQISMWWKLNG